MNNLATARIAFIGGGNMAQALIGGLLRQGVGASQLCVGEPQAAMRAHLEREFGVRTASDNGAAVEGATAAVLAIKPEMAPAVLSALEPSLARHMPVLVSIVAGLRLVDLSRQVPHRLPLVRAMPNRPALVGAGITALYAASDVSAVQRALA